MTISEQRIEAAAKAIFESWLFRAQVKWVERGNSDKQYEARHYARAALEADAPALASAHAAGMREARGIADARIAEARKAIDKCEFYRDGEGRMVEAAVAIGVRDVILAIDARLAEIEKGERG